MDANVYDFDKTIFDGDSTQKFYFYLLKKYPKLIIYWPKQLFCFTLFLIGRLDKTSFKEKFYSCFKIIKNIDYDVELFWVKYKSKIKNFYIKNQQPSDIIISASPEFLLKPICKKLGINYLIASKVDCKTGKYTGLNCFGQEKVNRLNIEIPNTNIKNFYSDSYSDEPLALLAQKSYMVVGENLFDWWEYKNGK